MLDALKQETIRLYVIGEMLPSVAGSVMTNISRRIVQIQYSRRIGTKIYY
jgi:hypothetical protein